MKKAFEIETGPKQECRDNLCAIAAATLGQGNIKKIFTLPSKEALCYTTFKRHYPRAKIACIERDAEICASLWADKNIDCANMTVSEYANEKIRKEQHHDLCFLDYYSFLSPTILKETSTFISNSNIIHKGAPSIIAITLMKGMRVGKVNTIARMKSLTYKGKITEVENTLATTSNAMLVFFAGKCKEVSLLHAREYNASDTSTKMYFLVFKILK